MIKFALFFFVFITNCYAEKYPDSELAIVREIVDFTKEHSVKKDIDDSEITSGILKGALSSIDAHSTYYTEKEYKKLQETIGGSFSGVGVYIELQDGLVHIIGAIKDMPAEKAGIKNGDIITHIEEKSTFALSLDEVSSMLRGKKGTNVSVTVVRKDEKEPLKFSIKRDNIVVQSVVMKKIDDILFVTISYFNEQTFNEFTKLFEKQKDYKGIVLDIRNNPGGVLDGAIALSSFFLDKEQKIVQVSNVADMKKTEEYDCLGFKKNCRKIKYVSNEDKIAVLNNEDAKTKLPLVVLVNEYSASASEITALAIQENKRGIIIGQKTFGKGSVQNVVPLKNGERGAIKLTTALYYSPNANSIQGNGVTPNVLIPHFKIEKQKQYPSFFPKKESENKNYIKVNEKTANDEEKQQSINEIEDFSIQIAISSIRMMIEK